MESVCSKVRSSHYPEQPFNEDLRLIGADVAAEDDPLSLIPAGLKDIIRQPKGGPGRGGPLEDHPLLRLVH